MYRKLKRYCQLKEQTKMRKCFSDISRIEVCILKLKEALGEIPDPGEVSIGTAIYAQNLEMAQPGTGCILPEGIGGWRILL